MPCQVPDLEDSCWVTDPIYDRGAKAFCLCDGGVADQVQPMGATDHGQESGSWSRQWSCSGEQVQVEGSGREGDMEDPHGFFVRGEGGIAGCD